MAQFPPTLNHRRTLEVLGNQPPQNPASSDEDEAFRKFLEAYEQEPANSDVVNALAIFYFQMGRLEDARRFAQRLVELNPGAPGPQQMLMQIEGEMSR